MYKTIRHYHLSLGKKGEQINRGYKYLEIPYYCTKFIHSILIATLFLHCIEYHNWTPASYIPWGITRSKVMSRTAIRYNICMKVKSKNDDFTNYPDIHHQYTNELRFSLKMYFCKNERNFQSSIDQGIFSVK